MRAQLASPAMRAAVITEYGGPEVLEIQDIPAPEPGPDEVLVDVAASAGADYDQGSFILTTVSRFGGVDTDKAERFEFEGGAGRPVAGGDQTEHSGSARGDDVEAGDAVERGRRGEADAVGPFDGQPDGVAVGDHVPETVDQRLLLSCLGRHPVGRFAG